AAARRGPGAYTDFFLPLLRRCPSAMGVKNKEGETPGQILGWGPPWDSAEEEEEDEASREHQWRQKLLGELEDEWQEVTGRLEGEESEEERRLFQERARAKEEELRESRARRAQERAQEAHRAQPPRGAGKGNLWRFNDVPWPCPGGGDPEAMAAALVARGPSLEEPEALRRYLRVQQVRWHPDRFLQRFGSQIETWELGRVMGAVTALSQALNRRAEALK
ncbi:PREDICTED: NF-kappa-B inhibitor-like protein 1, partial [Myotis davidii]|uniref:NF-kappa-B inhibitor-like protein 1 n=1 Tax=Myotis davidii TaxID=225400 RepID=UPI0003EC0E25